MATPFVNEEKEDHLPPLNVQEYFKMANAAAPTDPHLHNEYELAMTELEKAMRGEYHVVAKAKKKSSSKDE